MAGSEGTEAEHKLTASTAVLAALLLVSFSIGHRVTSRCATRADERPNRSQREHRLTRNWISRRRWNCFTEGSVACLMGLATGVVVLVSGLYHRYPLDFNAGVFFTYLLPPIIFNAGFSMKKKRFFENIGTIMLFGVIGTFIMFTILSFGSSKLFGADLKSTDFLAIGAIFAATDSVATLQVLSQSSSPLLYSIVFGEGVMNDATSIVLLKSLDLTDMRNGITWVEVFFLLGAFLWLFTISLSMGVGSGLGCAFLLKKLKISDEHRVSIEVALIGITSYLSYLLAELAGMSGILAVFFAGITISHYAYYNISQEAQGTTKQAFATMSLISEQVIFVFVGLDTFDPKKWSNTKLFEAIWFFVGLNVLLVLGRALFVFPFCLLHNLYSPDKIPVKESFIIMWSGVMRGAVSTALAYHHFDPSGHAGTKGSTLIVTTLTVVLFSVVVVGGATRPLLGWLMPQRACSAAVEQSQEWADSSLLNRTSSRGDRSIELPLEERSWVHRKWASIDKLFMQPIFGGKQSWSANPVEVSIGLAAYDHEDPTEGTYTARRDKRLSLNFQTPSTGGGMGSSNGSKGKNTRIMSADGRKLFKNPTRDEEQVPFRSPRSSQSSDEARDN